MSIAKCNKNITIWVWLIPSTILAFTPQSRPSRTMKSSGKTKGNGWDHFSPPAFMSTLFTKWITYDGTSAPGCYFLRGKRRALTIKLLEIRGKRMFLCSSLPNLFDKTQHKAKKMQKPVFPFKKNHTDLSLGWTFKGKPMFLLTDVCHLLFPKIIRLKVPYDANANVF